MALGRHDICHSGAELSKVGWRGRPPKRPTKPAKTNRGRRCFRNRLNYIRHVLNATPDLIEWFSVRQKQVGLMEEIIAEVRPNYSAERRDRKVLSLDLLQSFINDRRERDIDMICTYKPWPGPHCMQIWNGVILFHWKAVQRADRLFVDRQDVGAPITRPEMAIGISHTVRNGATCPCWRRATAEARL